ncbi:MAG: SDR family NAD(P)-dependent oxidoreductase [Spirochaetaceae bacterium]
MNKRIMITGANAGLGKESARQLAYVNGTEKVILACRNRDKALAAQNELENITGKKIYEILIMDVSNLESVKKAVNELEVPIDALIMNAGGMGGPTPNKKTEDGVTHIAASNVLGHVLLLDELLKKKRLNNVALFAGTEAARGVPKMGMKRPSLKTSSVEEFKSIFDGSFFPENVKPMVSYGPVKYAAIMSLMSTSRKYPDIKILSMSPGGTSGTEAAKNLPGIMKFMMVKLMPLMGMMHSLETGAKRFVDGIADNKFESGNFYASKAKAVTGAIIDQSDIFPDLKNETFQDNANLAIHNFIK